MELLRDDTAGERLGGVYGRIRAAIVAGELGAGERLKVGALAERYGSSSNPVREALQQLRGEGLVEISRNRGARVRPIDEDFLRNMYEITALLEPYMIRWFVAHASDAEVEQLEAAQAEIESAGLDDPVAYGRMDDRFHAVLNDRHYNEIAVQMWHHRREALRIIAFRIPFSRARREAILHEHRGMIECVRRHDGDGAAALVTRHIEGAARHVIEHLRAARASDGRRRLD